MGRGWGEPALTGSRSEPHGDARVREAHRLSHMSDASVWALDLSG